MTVFLVKLFSLKLAVQLGSVYHCGDGGRIIKSMEIVVVFTPLTFNVRLKLPLFVIPFWLKPDISTIVSSISAYELDPSFEHDGSLQILLL